jgi:hypothetical protein
VSFSSPRLGLPYLQPSQAQKHVTHNEALQRLDALVQLAVADFGATVPPAAPEPGAAWWLGGEASGAWAGQGGRLAVWDGSGWQFLLPRPGWRAWDLSTGRLRVFTGAGWELYLPPLQNLAAIGINTTAEGVNRLAVAAPATLFSHDGGDHRLKINKAGAADTASLVFQSGFDGCAEIGLAGELNLSFKVSDGAVWRDALVVARTTGRVNLPQGAIVQGSLTGSAVQAGPADATPGRLLAVGAFGLGGPLPLAGNIAATDGSLAPGLWSYDTGAGSTGGPAGVTRGALLMTRRAAAAGETQLLVVEEGGAATPPGLVLSRARSGGAWSAWLSGAAVETGANANGEWLRFANGVQECWSPNLVSDTPVAVGALWRSGPLAWTFPAAFAAAPVVSPANVNSPGTNWGTARAVSALAGEGVIFSTASLLGRSLRLRAIGRWF